VIYQQYCFVTAHYEVGAVNIFIVETNHTKFFRFFAAEEIVAVSHYLVKSSAGVKIHYNLLFLTRTLLLLYQRFIS